MAYDGRRYKKVWERYKTYCLLSNSVALKTFGRTILAKENRPYILAELGGIVGALVGYGAAVPTTAFLLNHGVRDEFNVLLTYTTKNSCFVVANIVTFSLLHVRPWKHLGQLVRSNAAGLVISAALSLGGHYAILKTQVIRPELAPITVYPVAAVIGSGYRHARNYRRGVICGTTGKDLDDLCR